MPQEKPHVHFDDMEKVRHRGEVILDDKATRVGEKDVDGEPESDVDVDAMLDAMSEKSGQDLKASDFPKKKAA